MSTVDPRDEQIAALTKKLQEYEAAKKPAGSSRFAGVGAKLKAIAAGVAAALTSPDAIKAEKSLAALVLTRLVVLVPTAAGIVLVIIKALGGPDTGVTP